MKRIIYLLFVIGAVAFTGCNPLEDINNEIDAKQKSIVGEDEFTMSSDDYAAIVEQDDDEDPDYYETFESFSSVDDAKTMLPAFLSDKYPLWGQGSSVLVHYNLYDGNPEEVSAYTNAEVYELVEEDYPTAASNAFYPDEDPSLELDGILLNQIATPEVGDVVRVEYKQFTEEPTVGLAPVVEYNFADSLESWTVVDVIGSGAGTGWTQQLEYVQGNGYVSGTGQVANEDWLISPEIDLTNETDLRFQISQAINYAGDLSLLKILVSTDFTGDQAAATWNEITLATAPAGNSNDMILSEDYDFSAYDGEIINIAFKYESTDSDAARWRVESLAIKTIGISGETETKNAFYTYTESGEWDVVEDVMYLSAADYDLMGEASGQPGQYNNFSSSVLPQNYLPSFLDIKYPFAQEEDSMFIVYKYYGGSAVGTVTKGNLYTFTNGVWSPSIASLQFGFDNGVWVPDNTIKYTLTNADYEYIGAELETVEGYADLVGTLVDYHDYDYNWSNDQILFSLGVLADHIDPNAEEGQKYLFSYLVYDNGLNELSMHIVKTDGEWIPVSN